MKKVILFKAQSEDYAKVFQDCKYETVFVEPLQFVNTHVEELSAKLLDKQYDGLILTSARAVEAVAKCWDPARFVLWHSRRVYTVGEASAHKIKLLLGLEALGTTTGNAENLANVIVKENPASATFLFPCGNLRSESLPSVLDSAGITVDSLTVYETKENENLKEDLMQLNALHQTPCCMVFFSPSGCEYVYRQLQTFSNNLTDLPHFAIGNSTAHKIENLGVEIAGVAARPQPESILESVCNYFSTS